MNLIGSIVHYAETRSAIRSGRYNHEEFPCILSKVQRGNSNKCGTISNNRDSGASR